jgi:hypothetical protein
MHGRRRQGGGQLLLGQRGPVRGALPPVAQEDTDLREEPSSTLLPLGRRRRLAAPRSSAAAVVAGPTGGAVVAVRRRVLEDGVRGDRPAIGVVVQVGAVDAEVLKPRGEGEVVRVGGRAGAAVVLQDVGQVPSLRHHMIHLHANEQTKKQANKPHVLQRSVSGHRGSMSTFCDDDNDRFLLDWMCLSLVSHLAREAAETEGFSEHPVARQADVAGALERPGLRPRLQEDHLGAVDGVGLRTRPPTRH